MWEDEEEDANATTICHEKFDDYHHFMTRAQFWLEGVSLLVVGICGMAGNVVTIIVLGRIDSNTTFNRLLMTLGKGHPVTHAILIQQVIVYLKLRAEKPSFSLFGTTKAFFLGRHLSAIFLMRGQKCAFYNLCFSC